MSLTSYRYDYEEITAFDQFSGCGGTLQGAHKVRYLRPILAANHDKRAIESHAANFPDVDHYQDDIQTTDITYFPYAHLFLSSPSCPPWSDARGKKRDFDKSNQQLLFGEGPDEQTTRNRLLMEEVPRYLRHWIDKGRPVLGGMVENVIQCRKWDQWDRWIGEIKALGYKVRVIALNSMHANGPKSLRAPQSRDRLYLGYVHESVGREPDWDKWLRPRAHCRNCDETVAALQVFKKPGADMGRYGSQYLYRCPKVSCRNRVIEPSVMPASTAIDWALPGTPIGARPQTLKQPDGLAPATLARIRAGIAKYWTPLLTPAGGTWRNAATSVMSPMPCRTTRETDGLAVPPLFVPVEGRPGKVASTGDQPLRTQTARNETGVAFPPFMVPLRGGGDKEKYRPITDPLHTVTAGGNHHGFVTPPAMLGERAAQQHLLVPYYSNGNASPVTDPIGTLSTRDRYALVEGMTGVDLAEVLFRMLEPREILRGMAFADDYIVLGNRRDVVRQGGNAVTPPVAECIVSALVECITGEDLEPAAA